MSSNTLFIKYPDNFSRVKRIKELVFCKGELSTVEKDELNTLIHPDASINSQANFKHKNGPDGLRDVLSYWDKAFTYPDKNKTWVSVKKNDDLITIEWKTQAISTGEDFFGIKVKGCPVEYGGKTTYKFHSGHLISYSSDVDIEGLKQQLRFQRKLNPKL